MIQRALPRIIITWLLFYLVIPIDGFAQGLNILPVTLITQADSLNETDNRFLYQDTEGYTLISSIHGLYRYDGRELHHYIPNAKSGTSLNGFIVNGFFFEDRQRNVWFSTYDAINCYVRLKDEFVSYKIPSNDAPGYFTGGLDSLNQLWFLWDTLLMTFHIEEHRFDTICTVARGASRLQIILDYSGKAHRAFIYNTERSSPGFQLIDLQDKTPVRFLQFYEKTDTYPVVVRNIYVENDTSCWIASHYGLIHLNPESRDTTMYSPINKNERVFFNHVVQMNDSILLIVSYGRGAYKFDRHKRVFLDHYRLAYHEQIIQEPLQTLYRDRNGGIWISITGKGVAYFHPDNLHFKYYLHTLRSSEMSAGIHLNTMIELNVQSVFAASNLHGAVLLLGPDSIQKQYNREITPTWKANNTRYAFKDHLGRIWTMTASGPCVWYAIDDVQFAFPDSNFYAGSICETQENEILLGPSDGGLYACMEVGDRKFQLKAISGIDNTSTYQYLYLHTDHRLYGAADMKSLDIFEMQGGIKLIKSIPLKAYTHCMVGMNGGNEIWIGSNEGIFIYTSGTDALARMDWLAFLDRTMVYGIVSADDPFIWVSTNQGLFRLNKEEKTFQWFHTSHGTGTLAFNPFSFLKRANGEIWFGSHDGITIVPRDLNLIPVPSSDIHLRKILINDAEWPGMVCSQTGAKNVEKYQALDLPYANNTLSFSFNVFDYAGPSTVVYEYRMTGIDTAWVKSGNHGFARYANLRPGNYIFQARAMNGTAETYSPVRSLSIHITAPLYRRSWFIVLLILMTGILAFYLYSFNEKRKRRIQQLVYEKKLALETERIRIANDMHDDLGSGLSALSLRAKLLADQVKNPILASQIHDLVGNTNRLAQQIRETIWAINSKNDTVDSLVTRLHQYALDYFEGTGIHCIVEIMQEQIFTPITGAVRREIYLAFKEALHNVQKHANATEVIIRIFTDDSNGLIVQILDKGQGFDPQSPTSGMGLSSMRKRLQDIGGSLSISSDHQGTHITLTYPI